MHSLARREPAARSGHPRAGISRATFRRVNELAPNMPVSAARPGVKMNANAREWSGTIAGARVASVTQPRGKAEAKRPSGHGLQHPSHP